MPGETCTAVLVVRRNGMRRDTRGMKVDSATGPDVVRGPKSGRINKDGGEIALLGGVRGGSKRGLRDFNVRVGEVVKSGRSVPGAM